MRVTDGSYYRTILSDLMYQQMRQMRLDKSIATGRVVNSPSDAPAVAVTIMDSRQLISTANQYNRNISSANDWLKASESKMDSIRGMLAQAKTLAEKMSTGTYSKQEQIGSASEVQNIIDEIINLANVELEGDYIFGGSRTNTAPITNLLQAAAAPVLAADSGPGHDTAASLWQDADGYYHLRLTRNTTGSGATVGLKADNTLGDSVSGMNFDWPGQWAVNQSALAEPPRAQIVTNFSTVANASTGRVSSVVGEELSWTPNSTVGLQTYRTDGVLTVSGACTVDVVFSGGPTNTYNASGASNLVDLINAANNPNYFAWLEGNDQVHVVSTGTTFTMADNGSPPGNLSVDQDHTMQELVSEINSGLRAAGVLRISGPPPANFQPAMNQTVTIGDYTWTWGQITNDTTLATAGDYANALTGWITSHTDAYSASTVFSGSGANVQLLSRAVGTAGNVTISSTNTTITTTGAMYGGLDGSAPATTGRIYGKGTSNLRLGTSIKGTVLSAAGTTISFRLRWFDDSGVQHTQDVDLPKSGEDNSVEVTGMGGLRIYRDSANFHEGAVFTLDVGHYQGNDETLSVNYSESGGRLAYNYTARQILGDNETVSLMDARASARNNSGDGAVMLTGAYRGLKSRQITFDVLDGGQVPGDNVTFRVSWIGDDGLQHSEEVALRGVGPENGIVLPLTGVRPKVDLTGVTPTANPANTGSGVVHFDGTYRGLGARDFNIECVNDGAVPGADLTLRVTWTDDKAVRHQEDVAVPQSAIDNKVEIPGSEGVYLYVDDINNFQVGDRYEHKIAMYPDKAGEGVFFHIDNGSFDQGDSFFQEIKKDSVHVLDTLKEWRYQLADGTREQGQVQSQRALEALDKQLKSILDYVAGAGTRQDRIKVRENVLTENKLYASQNLEEFQDVDVTQAFLDMRSMQTAYSAALKSISMMTQMSLLTQM